MAEYKKVQRTRTRTIEEHFDVHTLELTDDDIAYLHRLRWYHAGYGSKLYDILSKLPGAHAKPDGPALQVSTGTNYIAFKE